MVAQEIREAIEDACESQVAISGYESRRLRKPIPVERATDLIRRFAQNVPSEMTMADLCDELCHANNQAQQEA